MTFAGTRSGITKEIRIRGGIVTIATIEIIATIVRDMARQVDGTIVAMTDHGVG
jgi:hypothetical protein